MSNLLTFEHGTSELVNLSLRVEYLIKKLHLYIERDLPFDRQSSISTMLELLQYLNKQELRSKYFKEFSHAAYILQKLQGENVCQDRLKQTLDSIQKQISDLSLKSGKFADELRSNLFFKQLQNQLNSSQVIPCQNPEYHYWINQADDLCLNELHEWAHAFDEIKHVITHYLTLTRQACQFTSQIASSGFYQEQMDSRTLMVRLQIDKALQLYPKMSLGQHGVSIQFFCFSHTNIVSTKATDNVDFNIAYCYLCP